MCSLSTFVTTAYVDGTFIKLPSDSSDSRILHSLLPSLTELSSELITPPLIMEVSYTHLTLPTKA